jgi:tripartite-type tricarboxylate transporter receptor subunit TctC
LAQPDIKARLTALGFEAIGSTPDYFATYIASEMAKYGKIIRDANIKAE